MMDPVVLSLTVCLLAGAQTCRTEIVGDPFPTPVGCLMAGEEAAVAWLKTHPAYRLSGWRCGREEQGA